MGKLVHGFWLHCGLFLPEAGRVVSWLAGLGVGGGQPGGFWVLAFFPRPANGVRGPEVAVALAPAQAELLLDPPSQLPFGHLRTLFRLLDDLLQAGLFQLSAGGGSSDPEGLGYLRTVIGWHLGPRC